VRLLICAPSFRRVSSAESQAWTLAWRRRLPALDGCANLIADEPIRREANRSDHPQQHAGAPTSFAAGPLYAKLGPKLIVSLGCAAIAASILVTRFTLTSTAWQLPVPSLGCGSLL